MTDLDPSNAPDQPGLTLQGLTEDTGALVLRDAGGATYELAVTPQLRSFLNSELPTPTPKSSSPDPRSPAKGERSMESALRPRDIQSRIRAGQTPEAVAAAAQTSIERIMPFALPVLAERAHVAEKAQRASVRRHTTSEGSAPSQPLGHLNEAVAATLRASSIDPASVEWDAWRREDGRWTLTASYGAGSAAQEAIFVYDAAGRYVVPDDDASRLLVGVQVSLAPTTSDEPTLLDDLGPDELGVDAIELVREQPAGSPTARTTDLTETARALRVVPDQPGSDDWMSTQVTPRAPRRELVPEPAQSSEDIEEVTDTTEADADDSGQRPKRKGRASMPSWDEIMFGAGGRD